MPVSSKYYAEGEAITDGYVMPHDLSNSIGLTQKWRTGVSFYPQFLEISKNNQFSKAANVFEVWLVYTPL